MTPKLRLIALGLIGLLGLSLAAWVTFTLFVAPRRAAVANGQAIGSNNSAVAARNAAEDTVHIIVDNQAAHGRIDVVTQGNVDAIRNAPGASAAVDPAVHAAGLRALCLYDAYRLQPACRELLNPGPGQPPQGH